MLEKERVIENVNGLLRIIEDLLADLRVTNPEYRFATDVADNACYFANSTDRGVNFDIPKIEAVKSNLTEFKSRIAAGDSIEKAKLYLR